jgi:hypothetical protein
MIITCACGGFGEPHVVGSKDRDLGMCLLFYVVACHFCLLVAFVNCNVFSGSDEK